MFGGKDGEGGWITGTFDSKRRAFSPESFFLDRVTLIEIVPTGEASDDV